MNGRQALDRVRKALRDTGIEDSALEGEILLRHVLEVNRASLFSHLDRTLTPDEKEKLDNLLQRRLTGEPSSYIVGKREFFNLDFTVDNRVLIPRPETELLVENAISLCKKCNYTSVADVGTGSGCIAISLAISLPGAKVYASDISLPALEVAEENSLSHNLKGRIEFLWGDLLAPLSGPVDLIVANLPYVKTCDIVSHCEPERALDGGADGLDKIKELCGQLKGKLNPGGALMLEVGQGQAQTVSDYLHNLFASSVIDVFKDLAGIERVVGMRLTA